MKEKNDFEFAAALKYKREQGNAPKLTAKGRGALAMRIVDIANQEGIPIVEDRDLATMLKLSEVGDEIPPDLYKAVAEIFAFLYKINSQIKEK